MAEQEKLAVKLIKPAGDPSTTHDDGLQAGYQVEVSPDDPYLLPGDQPNSEEKTPTETPPVTEEGEGQSEDWRKSVDKGDQPDQTPEITPQQVEKFLSEKLGAQLSIDQLSELYTNYEPLTSKAKALEEKVTEYSQFDGFSDFEKQALVYRQKGGDILEFARIQTLKPEEMGVEDLLRFSIKEEAPALSDLHITAILKKKYNLGLSEDEQHEAELSDQDMKYSEAQAIKDAEQAKKKIQELQVATKVPQAEKERQNQLEQEALIKQKFTQTIQQTAKDMSELKFKLDKDNEFVYKVDEVELSKHMPHLEKGYDVNSLFKAFGVDNRGEALIKALVLSSQIDKITTAIHNNATSAAFEKRDKRNNNLKPLDDSSASVEGDSYEEAAIKYMREQSQRARQTQGY